MDSRTTENRRGHYMLALILIIAGVTLDQFTKHLASAHLKGKEPFVILKNIFELQYLENRGAAFGLFQNQHFFFLVSVIVITIAVIIFYTRVPMDKKYMLLRFCAIFVMAGAYGNCIDRIKQGYVIDFFYFKLIDFPVFNVADIYVTTATFLLFLLIIFYYKEEDLEQIFHSRRQSGRADR